MTFYTRRNNIQPMLFSIALVVVILFCLVGTVMTLHSIKLRQLPIPNGVIYSNSCLVLFWITRIILFSFSFPPFALGVSFFISFFCNFTFLCFLITSRIFPVYSLAPFCSSIFFFVFGATGLATVLMTVLCASVFVKLRERFELLASATSFLYDFSSHSRLLNRRFWLGPIAAHTAVGSSYYIGNNEDVKSFFENSKEFYYG